METPPPWLNLFALPSRTTLLFLLILIVIYVPLCATLFSPSPVCAPILLFWMIVLPLRFFLRHPERVIAQQHFTPIAQDSPLNVIVEQEAREIAAVPLPRVMVSPRAWNGVLAFGTFRRAYLGFSDALAQEIERLHAAGPPAAARARAIVLHELAHWRHNDVWLAALAQSVLVVAIVFIFLNLIVHFLTPLLYYRFLTFYDFTQSPWRELISILERDTPNIREAFDPNNPIVAARWIDYLVAIFSSFAPLIVGSMLLLFFSGARYYARASCTPMRAWYSGKMEMRIRCGKE